jgi:hypothetical protein
LSKSAEQDGLAGHEEKARQFLLRQDKERVAYAENAAKLLTPRPSTSLVKAIIEIADRVAVAMKVFAHSAKRADMYDALKRLRDDLRHLASVLSEEGTDLSEEVRWIKDRSLNEAMYLPPTEPSSERSDEDLTTAEFEEMLAAARQKRDDNERRIADHAWAGSITASRATILAEGSSAAMERLDLGHGSHLVSDLHGKPRPRLLCAMGAVDLYTAVMGSPPTKKSNKARGLCAQIWDIALHGQSPNLEAASDKVGWERHLREAISQMSLTSVSGLKLASPTAYHEINKIIRTNGPWDGNTPKKQG